MADAPDLLPPLPESVSKWQGLALPQVPAELTAALEGITSLGNATISVLNLIKDVLTILADITINLDPQKAILSAAIAAIEAGLKSLLESSGLYILFVPVRRRVIVSPLIQDALAQVGLSGGVPNKTLNLDLLIMQAKLAAQSKAVVTFLNDPANGGNVGFFRTVVESVFDEHDSRRPMFTTNDYVAGLHVVAGASDYAQLLSLLTALDGLLLPPMSDGLQSAGLPVPQNLKVQSVVTLDGAPAAHLSWDLQTAFLEIASLHTACLITHIAVIRSSNPKSLNVSTPEALFGTNKLTAGMTSTSEPGTSVVAILDYVTTPTTFDDYSGFLEEGVTYYYHAVYRLKVGTLNEVVSGGTYSDQGFYKLSNAAVATATVKTRRSSRGARPDWIRTKSVATLLPVVGDLSTLLVSTLKQFKLGTFGVGDNFKTYVKFLQGEIDRFAALLALISGTVAKITALSAQTPSAGIYGRAFSGKGGVDFMLADLGASLAPTNPDTGRPPFDRGDEFVAGLTLVVGGPSEAAVSAVVVMIQTLFGIGSGGASPLDSALAAIDAVLTAREEVHLAADFSQTTSALTESVPSTNPALSDTDPGNCGPDTTSAPVFGDDFGVS